MAKKAKAKKAKAKTGKAKRAVKAPALSKRTSAKRGRSRVEGKQKAKKAAPKPRPTRASKTKIAARAAATRNPKEPPKPKPGAIASAAKIAAGVALLAYDQVAKRLPWAKNENDPIALLQVDHRRFETLLKEGEETTERAKKGRREILKALTAEVNVHEAIEEKILYPALEGHAEAHDLVLESTQEHHVADTIVKELHEVATDDEQWGAKFKVFKENLSHHISEEEYKLFPIARGVLTKDELLALGKKMRELKSQLEK